eukprot:13007536-Ditylum_brightwellii.AAC.1
MTVKSTAIGNIHRVSCTPSILGEITIPGTGHEVRLLQPGHQDDTTPYGKLDWTSQQNVGANKLEGDFLDQHAVYSVHAPCVQGNKAQLIVQGKSITGHYITEIKRL